MSDFSRYEQPAASLRPLGLQVTGVGHRSPSGACGPRTLTQYGVVLIERGTGWLETTGGGVQLIRSPSLFWLFPGVAHTYGSDTAGWSERWSLFDGPFARTCQDLGLITPERPLILLNDPQAAETSDLFDGLQRDFSRKTAFASVLGAAWIHRLIVTLHVSQREGQPEDQSVVGRLCQAADTLEHQACGGVSIDSVAAAYGFTISTFRRRFRAQTGYSPQEYVTRTRLARAKMLLAQGTLPITDVARQCGYDDPFYFSRVFTAKEGASPSAFRKQQYRG